MVIAVAGVAVVELVVGGGDRGLVGACGDGPLDEAADAVAHERAGLGKRALGHAECGERVVEREVQVLERVEQCSVQVEDHGLVQGCPSSGDSLTSPPSVTAEMS